MNSMTGEIRTSLTRAEDNNATSQDAHTHVTIDQADEHAELK